MLVTQFPGMASGGAMVSDEASASGVDMALGEAWASHEAWDVDEADGKKRSQAIPVRASQNAGKRLRNRKGARDVRTILCVLCVSAARI